MTGFFPIFMFALPAAALAIWQTAKPSQKKVVGGVMIAAALTSFITGVTEPIEFSFMFIAWPLYIFHAIMTGLSLALVNALGIHLGFSFSGGAIDFALNSTLDTAHEGMAAHPDRPGLRGDLLLRVPHRHHQVEPEDAGPRGRLDRGGSRPVGREVTSA